MKIMVDMDNTLIYTNFIRGDYILTGINEELKDRLNALSSEGHEIIIWSSLSDRYYDEIIRYLDKMGISYDELKTDKPRADYYIDKKGITAENFLELIF